MIRIRNKTDSFNYEIKPFLKKLKKDTPVP